MKNGEGQNLSRFCFKATGIFWWTGLIEVPRRHGYCAGLIVHRAHVPAISTWSLQLYGQFGARCRHSGFIEADIQRAGLMASTKKSVSISTISQQNSIHRYSFVQGFKEIARFFEFAG